MEDDGYIHWNLIQHMQKAAMVDGDAYNLLVNLRWVAAKLKITGPADLLNDYISVRKSIKSEVKYVSYPINLLLQRMEGSLVPSSKIAQ